MINLKYLRGIGSFRPDMEFSPFLVFETLGFCKPLHPGPATTNGQPMDNQWNYEITSAAAATDFQKQFGGSGRIPPSFGRKVKVVESSTYGDGEA